jgi:hypothetical protein
MRPWRGAHCTARQPGDARRRVSRVLYRPQVARWACGAVTAIPLGRPLPDASCDRPERRRKGPPGTSGSLPDACRSYLVLLPVGFSLPPPLPAARCALTAPFHPCRPPEACRGQARRYTFCGTFPGVAPAGRYPAPYLRGARTFLSPHDGGERPPDRLASQIWTAGPPLSKTACSKACGQGLVMMPTAAANSFFTFPLNSGLTSRVVLPALASTAVGHAM